MLIQAKQKLLRRSGQGLAEYAMLLAFVIAFIMAVRNYFQVNLSGMVTDQVDILKTQMGSATKYAPTTNSTTDQAFNATRQGTGAEQSDSQNTTTSVSTVTF